MMRLVLALALLLGIATLSSGVAAGRTPPGEPVPANRPFPNTALARIVVSQDDQQLLIYEGERLLYTLPVSTGWPGVRKTTTPVWSGRIGHYWGSFESHGTMQDHGYWLFTDYLDDGEWNGDILIHGAPYVLGPQGERVYELDGLGRGPVSNGCIRLEPADAAWFNAWHPVDVPIVINPFTRGTLAYPKLGVGAQLLGMAQGANGPVAAETHTLPLGQR